MAIFDRSASGLKPRRGPRGCLGGVRALQGSVMFSSKKGRFCCCWRLASSTKRRTGSESETPVDVAPPWCWRQFPARVTEDLRQAAGWGGAERIKVHAFSACYDIQALLVK